MTPSTLGPLPIVSAVTYLQFLVVFVGLPIIVLLVALRRQLGKLPWALVSGICLVALVYTTPWDNLLVLNGVWAYPPQRVLNVILGVVPLEEYGFFILQTVMTSLLTLWLIQQRRGARI